jgi:hypothetical protein
MKSKGKYNHNNYLKFLANGSTMHVACGTDVELTCPIRSTKKTDQVVRFSKERYNPSKLIIRFFLDFMVSSEFI